MIDSGNQTAVIRLSNNIIYDLISLSYFLFVNLDSNVTATHFIKYITFSDKIVLV